MNRIATLVIALSAAAFLAGCGGNTCGPDNCGGCCDGNGVCQSAGNNTCGIHGATCEQCVSSKVCEAALGQCVFPGSTAGNGNGNNTSGASSSTTSTSGSTGSAASTTDTGSSSSSATSTTGSSSSSSSTTSTSGTSGSTGTTTSNTSSSSSSASGTTSGTTGTTSTSTTTGTTTSTSTTTGTTSTSTTTGTTGTTTTGTTTTTGGEGSGALAGPDAFTVQSALEFTATLDGGGADLTDALFILYDAPVTCSEVLAIGAVPSNVTRIAIGEVHNLFGFDLQGGTYVIPYDVHLGVNVDADYFYVRSFFPDGGSIEHDASSGQINISTSPVNTIELNATPFGNLDDGSQLSGTVAAPFCGTLQ